MSKNNIWLQPGTRAHMLVYQPITGSWRVWTSTNSRSGSDREWCGTYMEMHPDGRCIQVTRTETDYHEITVRPAFE
jgi:hypothetical protein